MVSRPDGGLQLGNLSLARFSDSFGPALTRWRWGRCALRPCKEPVQQLRQEVKVLTARLEEWKRFEDYHETGRRKKGEAWPGLRL